MLHSELTCCLNLEHAKSHIPGYRHAQAGCTKQLVRDLAVRILELVPGTSARPWDSMPRRRCLPEKLARPEKANSIPACSDW